MKKVKILSLLLTLSMVGCLMSFPAQATVSDAVRSEAAQPDAPASEPDMIVSETREVIEYGTSAKPEEDASKGASSSAEATTLADGVYAIKNVMYSSRWMSVEGGYPLGGSIHLQQTAYSASPVSNFTHLGLFKISRVGTTNRYIIRTLTSNDVSFGISGNQLVSKIIPSNDASVAASDTFYIEPYSGGYKIRPYGSSSVIYISSTSTTNVGLIASGSATTAACWTFEPYTGNHRHGCTIYRPSSWKGVGMIQEQTTSTAIAGWSTRINVNDVSAAVVSGDEALADLSWNTTANNLTIIPNNPGRLNFQVYIGTSANPRAYTISSFDFSIVPPTGTYYIQNVGTDKCIDIEGPSKASGAVLQQWQFHIGSQEKWILEHVPNSDGRVRFKSLYSNLYMGIDSANTTSVKQYGTQNDYTLWLIDRTASGNLILTCKATGSSGVVLSVPLNSNANGTNLTQLAYTDNTNYRDEWNIYIFKDASLIALPEGYDRSSFFSVVEEYIYPIGYTDVFNNHEFVSQGMSNTELLNRMRCSRITLVRTHGSKTRITTTSGHLSISDLQNMSSSGLIHSGLIIYGACSTASGGATDNNLVVATVAAGARTVIGFEDVIYSVGCNRWCTKFFELYAAYYENEEKTIEDVLRDTDTYMQDDPYYEGYITTEDGEIILVSLRNYVVVGEVSFSD